MYDTYFFRDNKKLLKWAMDYTCASKRAKPYVGWDGAINFVHMTKDLVLLYQLAKRSDSFEVVMLHMLLWSERRSLRKDVFKVTKFFRPEGEILWHSEIDYEGRTSIPFVVANAWMKEEYDKYSMGGCFEMSFSGIGHYLECINDKGTIRFYEGNPVEMKRKDENDPSIDHADMYMTELRMLNSSNDDKCPARAEFAGIVEGCRTVTVCGEKCYVLYLWSGPMDSPVSFPWTLLVAANRIEGRYVPRTGDMVHGEAFMFGTFFGDEQKTPTVYTEQFINLVKGKMECALDSEDNNDSDSCIDAGIGDLKVTNKVQSNKPAKCKKEWEWLPRKPATYPECKHHGGGLVASVKKVHPKFVVYADYLKHIKGPLTLDKSPSRKELREIIDSIDYVVTKRNNLHVLAAVFDAIGIRHLLKDEKTGERHLWCCMPSGVWKEHYRTNLLIALDENNSVLRYSFHTGDWSLMPMMRGMAISINFQSAKQLVRYESIVEATKHIGEMKKDDYMIAASHGQTSILQAWCDGVNSDGVQKLRIEWHAHDLPWQFFISNGTKEQFVAMLKVYDKYGIEPVQTMARWRWCRMEKCNV